MRYIKWYYTVPCHLELVFLTSTCYSISKSLSDVHPVLTYPELHLGNCLTLVLLILILKFINFLVVKTFCSSFYLLQSEIDFLGKLSHPHLVRLLGYCWEDQELLLVYEFMQKGSLENHLFGSKS